MPMRRRVFAASSTTCAATHAFVDVSPAEVASVVIFATGKIDGKATSRPSNVRNQIDGA